MRSPRLFVLAGVAALLFLGGALRAETTVTLKGVHICCPNCIKTMNSVADKGGFDVKADRGAKTVTITAANAKAAQKAVDAIAAAGFYGTSNSKEVKIKDDSGAKAGKVARLTVRGAHNCCGNCCKALKAAVGKVDGVAGDTAKPKAKSFVVEGNFDAADLVKALNKAGFHVKVK
jgi:mercuric ion binding protein